MCGIAGLLPAEGRPLPQAVHWVRDMASRLHTRGPDAQGVWADERGGAVLGHRRLAIVELSPQGAQPMASPCGRWQIAFNGEIYNHAALRAELGGPWRGGSDTETLVTAVSRWGVEPTLRRLVGMFAFAAWDRCERSLTLARDRMGEKPLYWGRLADGSFAFASELKALDALPTFERRIDRDALTLLLRHNCVPAPHTIYQGMRKLPPGSLVELRADGRASESVWWDITRAAARGKAAGELPDAEMLAQLEALLDQSVAGQMMADVPLGAFLSGGVDSSLVVALMRRHALGPVRTFSIGFAEAGFDESVHARAVAAHLGTLHTELQVGAADALAHVPLLPQLYDEPFADSSQIPTFLVCKLARPHVTVALSGDGGDELFAGYTRYALARRLWRTLSAVPLPARRALGAALLQLPAAGIDACLRLPLVLAGRGGQAAQLGDRLHKFARAVLPAADQAALYRALVSHWADPSRVVLGSREPHTLLHEAPPPGLDDAVERMCLADQRTYLPDDILVKVDRAAMGVSLETRVPLLDHRLVEFSWRVSMAQKWRDGRGKWPLRQVLYRYVPAALIDRPKQGFGIPLAAWLRGPLRDWAEALLEPRRLAAEGYFDVAEVRRKWTEHLQGRHHWHYQLWDVLVFQAWHEAHARPQPAALAA